MKKVYETNQIQAITHQHEQPEASARPAFTETAHQPATRTGRLFSLFMATSLMLATGCAPNQQQDCVDQNQDGYCDRGGGYSSYYHGFSSGGGTSQSGIQSPNGVSSGVEGSKSGIGSSGSSIS